MVLYIFIASLRGKKIFLAFFYVNKTIIHKYFLFEILLDGLSDIYILVGFSFAASTCCSCLGV